MTPRLRRAPSSRRARAVAAVLESFVGIGALYGGTMLLADPVGLGVEEAWLDGSPFPSYAVPGLVLLVVIGGGMLAAAALAVRGRGYAAPAAFVMGVAVLVWGAVETLVIGYQGPAQLVLLAVFVAPGLVLAALGRHAVELAPRPRAPRAAATR